VLKREVHRQALVAAATGGQRPLLPRHRQRAACRRAEGGQSVCGAGCYTAPAALELYAEAFETPPARWTSWKASPATMARTSTACRATPARVTLRREPWQLPETVPFGDTVLKPLRGGDTLNWKLQ
jgi:dihydroorotase